jgi:hypothetical protein
LNKRYHLSCVKTGPDEEGSGVELLDPDALNLTHSLASSLAPDLTNSLTPSLAPHLILHSDPLSDSLADLELNEDATERPLNGTLLDSTRFETESCSRVSDAHDFFYLYFDSMCGLKPYLCV